FYIMTTHQLTLTLFPYTTLFRSQALVRGPFTTPYPGGLYAETSFYDKDSTVYYAYDPEAAKADFKAAGLEDTDGNGFVNFPGGGDRKSTRLNSSHVKISYAVFCL